MRALPLSLLLAVSLCASAQERSLVVRIEQPDSSPYPHLFLSARTQPGTIESVASLRGTPLYVAIVIEGGKDRAFGPALGARYARWLQKNPDLKGMMVAYAPDGRASGMVNQYEKLAKNIAELKPGHDARDYLADGIQYACQTLGAIQPGQNVRRVVLVISDPDPFSLSQKRPAKLLQVAQAAQVVLVVEDHTPFHGIAGFSLRELENDTPGLVLHVGDTQGEPASSTSFDEQAARLARALDQLYLVHMHLPPGHGSSAMVLSAYESGADIHPQAVLPFLRDSYSFLTRIRRPKGVTGFGPYTKFGLRFDSGNGQLQSLVSLKHSPIYVAIVIQGSNDPIYYQDLPARYVKWFAQDPDLRGMEVEFARDPVKKGPPPVLLGRTSAVGRQMTADSQALLQRIASYRPDDPADSFDNALHYAIEDLAEQAPGENVRRVLVIISHSRSYSGPSFNFMEVLQLANDADVVIAAEDHSWTEEASPFVDPFFGPWIGNWWPGTIGGGLTLGGPLNWVGGGAGNIWAAGLWPAGRWATPGMSVRPWTGGLASGSLIMPFCAGPGPCLLNPTLYGTLSTNLGTLGATTPTAWGLFLQTIADATAGVVLQGASHSQDESDRRESFERKTRKISVMLNELYRFRMTVLPSTGHYVQAHLVTNGSLLNITPQVFSIDTGYYSEDDTKTNGALALPAPQPNPYFVPGP